MNINDPVIVQLREQVNTARDCKLVLDDHQRAKKLIFLIE